MGAEPQLIRERYARRDPVRDAQTYDLLNPAVFMAVQERERAVIRWLRQCRPGPVRDLRLLEVGCGGGRTLLDLLRLGFRAENLTGNDLLEQRIDAAAAILPPAVKLFCCDAMELRVPEESFDVVVQSTMFTSIASPEYQASLARRMWNWVAPGGGVLWYDFVYNNPNNPDVRGIPFRRVRGLFPGAASIRHWRLTLAPPISRFVTRVHPSCYALFGAVPLLRTHILCWIEKRAA